MRKYHILELILCSVIIAVSMKTTVMAEQAPNNNLTALSTNSIQFDSAIQTLSIENNFVESSNTNAMFVGDSRTVGMNKYGIIDNSYEVIAKVGEGYDYLQDNLTRILSATNSNIIINLGVNDLGNVNKYIGTYRALSNLVDSSNNIYIVSVNPVEDYPTVTNEQIEAFNLKIKELCDSTDRLNYIDTYSIIKNETGYTVDGLHYNKACYTEIYNLITYAVNNKLVVA